MEAWLLEFWVERAQVGVRMGTLLTTSMMVMQGTMLAWELLWSLQWLW